MTHFFLDTNILFKRRFVSELSRQCDARSHRLCVSALVHMERVYQLRRQKGDGFDPAVVDAYISTHRIEIVPFDHGRACGKGRICRISLRHPMAGRQVAKVR